MSLLEWNNAQYSVKIDEFDNDHRKLVEYINELHSAMLSGKGKEKLSNILEELKKYTIYHFQEEEKQMLATSYPEYEEHKAAHTRLTDQLNELIRDFQLGKREVTIETGRFLKEWLFNHIQVVDKKYTPWLQKNQNYFKAV